MIEVVAVARIDRRIQPRMSASMLLVERFARDAVMSRARGPDLVGRLLPSELVLFRGFGSGSAAGASSLSAANLSIFACFRRPDRVAFRIHRVL